MPASDRRGSRRVRQNFDENADVRGLGGEAGGLGLSAKGLDGTSEIFGHRVLGKEVCQRIELLEDAESPYNHMQSRNTAVRNVRLITALV